MPRVAESTGTVECRAAADADLEGEYAVFVAAQQELHSRRGAAWGPAPPFDPAGRWAQVHRHLLTHDGRHSFVAEDGGRVVGFTAALTRGECWFFSALFIDPAYQGQGIGSRLLSLAWNPEARHRITITAGEHALKPAAPAPAVLRAIDLAAYGFDRAADHEFWARTSAQATLWTRDGKPCAYSYSGGLFGIGPVAGLDPASAAQALRAELAASADTDIQIDIPGTATSLTQIAIQAGLRLTDPGLLLLSPGQPPPTSYAIHSYWLL